MIWCNLFVFLSCRTGGRRNEESCELNRRNAPFYKIPHSTRNSKVVVFLCFWFQRIIVPINCCLASRRPPFFALLSVAEAKHLSPLNYHCLKLDYYLRTWTNLLISVKDYSFFVYITTNPARTVFYTGFTNNLSQRLVEHYMNRGTNKSFTGKYYYSKLLYYEVHQYVYNVMDREKEIKGWTRIKKL